MRINAFDMYIQEIPELLSRLDGKAFPEVHACLSALLEQFPEEMTAFEMANTLLLCDRSRDLPEFLISYITELFIISGEEGNADAWNNLGAQYYEGCRGFEQDFAKALKYYQIAAEQGSRQAQENLGYCYYYGRSVPVDYEKAFHYFALGAFDGHLISLYKIGDMYRNGYYVKKNEIEAFNIYMHCVDTMTEEEEPFIAGPVFLRLGDMFLHGLGTEQNPLNALVAYQKAELFLYQMVQNDQPMYRKSLEKAIIGQENARKALELPQDTWIVDR